MTLILPMIGSGYVAESGTVSFVAAGNYRINVSTSCPLSVPTGTVVGDLLVASTMSRSVTLTPTGWTNQVQRVESSSTSQATTIFTKVAEAGDLGSSINFQQVSSSRFLGQMLSFRKSTGSPSVLSTATSLQTNNTTHDLASVTPTAEGQMVVVAGSFIYANPSQATSISIIKPTGSDPDWIRTTSASIAQNRLGVGYSEGVNGVSSVGNMQTSYSLSSQSPQLAVLLG
mgnify:CR=1 FL=1